MRFLPTLWEYYDVYGRDLPWRQLQNGQLNPYHVLVSEVMLQQTQVGRVIPKYDQFLQQFPTLESLAHAPLAEVLKSWSGLGYNRRAKYLWQTANIVVKKGFPETIEGLTSLPGIGKNTAGAILAYAFDQPASFVETNIRTVIIHHFFSDQTKIADAAISEVLARVLAQLDRTPREFYWAMMDYGTYLKQTQGNLSQRSKHYSKQASFEGSKRQIRGQVLRLLSQQPMTLLDLKSAVNDERLNQVLKDLLNEELISQDQVGYHLYTS